ncbi:DUF2059 domain-containing protein [Pseudomonas citronellolis]|uniref:DUF2059 domain-containing protein n=1 Tax=Pseudomonas citronellolis TaxID=53408 RepID=UPI002111CFA7|nr:DUF2059 domain-containing protein [Pseudomonas citronellolis]UUC48627.1 DUF2059 domain-containing protein [Pseudomonas citronellolis]
MAVPKGHTRQTQGLPMTALRKICTAALLVGFSTMALADSAAEAEKFLKQVHADKLTVPVYAQVQQMFSQHFAQAKAPDSKKAVLDRYQAKANAELDRAVGWEKIKPELVKLYTDNFTESELKQLNDFYASPLGQKVLQKMPRLTAQSAQLTQAKLQTAVDPVNKLLADMDKELGVKAPAKK